MPTRLRKSRRQRGSRTVGWGRVGQHRKSGGRGGVGKAGLHKHKWTWTVKYAPEHFGGAGGFRPPGRRAPKKWINVGRLDHLFGSRPASSEAARAADKPLLNLTQLGFRKLLGGGEIKGAYRVIVESFSEAAKAKVEKAGGELLRG